MRLGLGDLVCDDETCYDDGSGSGSALPVFTPSNLCVTPDCLATGAPLTPAQQQAAGVTGNPTNPSSNPITSLLASLTNAASGAVKAAVTPAPYYVTNPTTGQSVLYNPATGAIMSGTGSSLSTLGTAGSSGLLLLMLAGFAIFAMEKH